jgi:hypothetical protein
MTLHLPWDAHVRLYRKLSMTDPNVLSLLFYGRLIERIFMKESRRLPKCRRAAAATAVVFSLDQ